MFYDVVENWNASNTTMAVSWQVASAVELSVVVSNSTSDAVVNGDAFRAAVASALSAALGVEVSQVHVTSVSIVATSTRQLRALQAEGQT